MRILLQTTIPYAENDWHIGRFSLLAEHLRSLGHDVTSRDRTSAQADDPVLASLDTSPFDQLWLFAVDTGDGITAAECKAITAFRARGGGIMATRDHADLGSSLCSLGGIGAAHHFHSQQPEPDESRRVRDDQVTTDIDWPNYHSGANGDVQPVEVSVPLHPVMTRADGSPIRTLPAHPHEGAVSAPPGDPTARVVAIGTSRVSGRRFPLAVAFERADGNGPGWAESTFHHFADYNWSVACGAPTFVSEPPSNALAQHPDLLDDTKTFVANLARWLSS